MSDASLTAERGSHLTPAQLAALKPHVINTEDGALASRGRARPATVDEFVTSAADVRKIVREHLPAFIAEHQPGPVPVMVWAHGGLVSKAAGFETAHTQVQWWRDNGVFPLHMVWETGLLTSVTDAVRRALGSRGFTDFTDGLIETGARLLGGRQIWEDMKLDAAANALDDGGATVLARELAAFMAENPDAITLHAVGHSAGSIFHSHFVPRALAEGVPEFETVSLLAPAVRLDTFEATLLPAAQSAKIRDLSVFTMTDPKERDDNVAGIYRKSLLYLVSRAFEPERDAQILGMAKHLDASAPTRDYLRATDDRLVLSPITNGLRRSSLATSHGDFDNDGPTMNSVARRVAGRDRIEEYPTATRSAPPADTLAPATAPWPPEATTVPAPAREPARRAVCIGVNAYPEPQDRLAGCVPDAEAWSQALRERGFAVETMRDAEATREAILSRLLDLVSTAVAGDILAVQFSGHGTHVPDLDGDEVDSFGPRDEAICPVDFREGGLIIDDDLALIWDLIPEGVSMTLFFDSCHSGTVSRGEPTIPDLPAGTAARLVLADEALVQAFARTRGTPAPGDPRSAARTAVTALETDRLRNTTHNRPVAVRREVLLSACLPSEVALERAGQGVFTAAALQVLAGAEQHTNRTFADAVVDALGARTQTPQLTASDVLVDRPLLAAAMTTDTEPEPDRPCSEEESARAADIRTAAIADILRATADLLAPGGR